MFWGLFVVGMVFCVFLCSLEVFWCWLFLNCVVIFVGVVKFRLLIVSRFRFFWLSCMLNCVISSVCCWLGLCVVMVSGCWVWMVVLLGRLLVWCVYWCWLCRWLNCMSVKVFLCGWCIWMCWRMLFMLRLRLMVRILISIRWILLLVWRYLCRFE